MKSQTVVRNKRVVVAGPKSDCHVVAISIVADYLLAIGLDVQFLGACCSIERLEKHLNEGSPVSRIIFGTSNGHAVEDLSGLDALKSKYGDIELILGGKISVVDGDSEQACRRLIPSIDRYFDDLFSLVSFFENERREGLAGSNSCPVEAQNNFSAHTRYQCAG